METNETRETPFILEEQKVRPEDFQTEGWIPNKRDGLPPGDAKTWIVSTYPNNQIRNK